MGGTPLSSEICTPSGRMSGRHHTRDTVGRRPVVGDLEPAGRPFVADRREALDVGAFGQCNLRVCGDVLAPVRRDLALAPLARCPVGGVAHQLGLEQGGGGLGI